MLSLIERVALKISSSIIFCKGLMTKGVDSRILLKDQRIK